VHVLQLKTVVSTVYPQGIVAVTGTEAQDSTPLGIAYIAWTSLGDQCKSEKK
jgi:hypothetical protein